MAATDTDVAEHGTGEHDEHAHGDMLYIKVAIFLALLTAAEVTTYTHEDEWGDFAIPAIFVMMTIKFVMVVLFFMHLKDDPKILATIFSFGMGLAAVVYAMTLLASNLFT